MKKPKVDDHPELTAACDMRNRLIVNAKELAKRHNFPLVSSNATPEQLFFLTLGALAFASWSLKTGDVDNLTSLVEAAEKMPKAKVAKR